MMVSPLSGSRVTRKVGSSLVKRCSALDMLSWALESTGLTDSEITGSGTYIEVMASRGPSPTKVSPEWQSMPNRPTMSPAPAVGDVLHLVGVHAHQPADLDLLAGAGLV